jgi:hypothetical protein
VAILPGLQERVSRQSAMLGGYTVGWLSELVKYADRLGSSEASAVGRTVTAELARSLGVGLAGAALACALARAGWSIESLPGTPVRMRRGEDILEPFSEAGRLARGEVDAESWQRRCAELGVRDLSLSPGQPPG